MAVGLVVCVAWRARIDSRGGTLVRQTLVRRAPSRIPAGHRRLAGVELVRLYSNRQEASERIARIYLYALRHHRLRPDAPPPIPWRVGRRLGAEQLERIVNEYVTGASTPDLARRYAIGKGTLLQLLREHGAPLRSRGRQGDQVRS